MRVVLNGEAAELPEDAVVSQAVEAAGASDPFDGVAVALDGEVVPRSEWESTRIAAGQRLEVLRAVQGG